MKPGHIANQLNLVAFLGMLGYFTTVVLFSYQEGTVVYAKYWAITIVLYFFGMAIFSNKVGVTLPKEYQFLMLWLFWALITTFFAADQSLAINKLITMLQILVISYSIFNVVIWQKSAGGHWLIVVVAALAACTLSFIEPTKYIGADGRMHGTVGNANLLALLLITATVVSVVYTFIFKKIILKLLATGIAFFLFYMVIETGSRKGMAGGVILLCIVMSVFSQFLYHVSKTKFLIGIVAGVCVLIAAGGYVLSSQHGHRLSGLVEAADRGDISDADRSMAGRIMMYEVALNTSLENPVFGIGLNNFREVRPVQAFASKIGSYSHSNYLELLVSTGFLGMVFYVSIYGAIICKLYRLRSAVLHRELVGDYAIALSLVMMYVMFDFAMVSYAEKLSWFILTGVIAEVYIIQVRMQLIRGTGLVV